MRLLCACRNCMILLRYGHIRYNRGLCKEMETAVSGETVAAALLPARTKTREPG